ncbi:DUF58 domain-containing protein [Frigoribacterium sp. 2-23]|uniref:DUF58 domain-containing protein n=1 Tax=Frigoribacterium sp. 2-23 TaxID=3415006 RepID=UPI003C6F0130
MAATSPAGDRAGLRRVGLQRGGVPRPTGRGFGVLAGGVVLVGVGWLLSSGPLVFAGLTLVVLIVAVVVSLLFRRADVTVTRRFSPTRGVAGRSVVETMGVSPRRREGGTVALRDEVPWRRTTLSEAVAVTLEPGRASSAAVRHLDLPRGRHRVGPLHLELIESYGVARRRVLAPGTVEFVVLPEALDLGLARESRSLGDGARRQREHSLAGGEDDPIAREYRRGDPMRRVHWKATARHGELMVRQEEQHGLPRARVVLGTASEGWSDVRPSSGTHDLASDAFEWAVSACATIGVEFGRAGSLTIVSTPDGDLLARHDPDDTSGFLDALADIELDGPAPEPAPAPTAREPVVAVVSGLQEAELEHLARGRAVGATAVAIVVHPSLAFTERRRGAGAGAGSGSSTSPVAPDRVAATLREAGWRVVEASSGDDRSQVIVSSGAFDD